MRGAYVREFILGPIHSDGGRVAANDRGVISIRYHFTNRSETSSDYSPPHSTTSAFRGRGRPSTSSRSTARRRWPALTSSSGRRIARYRGLVSTTRRRRPALVALVILAAAGCLALAWWQWSRFESTSGSFQNLGYALQWPMFAGFCVYAYYKLVRYQDAPPEPKPAGTVTEIPAGLLPERPTHARQSDDDPVLRQYNAYLAELAEADKRKQDD